MTMEEAVEGIKRHAEAILNLAREVGISDYLGVSIVNDAICIDNNPAGRHADDGKGVDLYFTSDGEWRTC